MLKMNADRFVHLQTIYNLMKEQKDIYNVIIGQQIESRKKQQK